MRDRIVRLLPLLVPAVLSGCAVFGDDRPGVAKVEDLVARVERLHVEVELSREAMTTAVQALRGVALPSLSGDKVEAFRNLNAVAATSRERASTLREALVATRVAADPVFEQWRAQLDGIASASVRARSEERLRSTRERYEAITQAVAPAVEDFDALNRTVNDLALFLDHDFNPTAVAAIHDDLVALDRDASTLDGRFERSLGAAQAYLAVVSPESAGASEARPAR
ncbi:MAG: DUF2959 family protein [Planctomycetota bacterium]